ncbi:hypothetical protein LTS01_023648 [Friedmanniomyces endolithicus]|nr:hypothetical protein LTS01_023648 [Friedmanniomyces endolithicus]
MNTLTRRIMQNIDDRDTSINQILETRRSQLSEESQAIQHHAENVDKAHEWAANLVCLQCVQMLGPNFKAVRNHGLARDIQCTKIHEVDRYDEVERHLRVLCILHLETNAAKVAFDLWTSLGLPLTTSPKLATCVKGQAGTRGHDGSVLSTPSIRLAQAASPYRRNSSGESGGNNQTDFDSAVALLSHASRFVHDPGYMGDDWGIYWRNVQYVAPWRGLTPATLLDRLH